MMTENIYSPRARGPVASRCFSEQYDQARTRVNDMGTIDGVGRGRLERAPARSAGLGLGGEGRVGVLGVEAAALHLAGHQAEQLAGDGHHVLLDEAALA